MKRNTVSLCLIARDEEATIGMAIKSVLALVDEVIVVDTGSQDNTRIIAEGYGAKVLRRALGRRFFRRPQRGPRSGHRQMGAGPGRGRIPGAGAAGGIPETAARSRPPPAIVCAWSAAGPATHGAMTSRVRLFRNVPEVRYRYPIHERLAPALSEWAAGENLLILDADLAVMHERSDSDRRAHRRERNQRILRKALVNFPDEPYFPYRLACEGQVLLDGEVLPVAGLAAALAHLRAAWSKIRSLDPDQQASLTWLPDFGAPGSPPVYWRSARSPRPKRSCGARNPGPLPEHPLVLLQSVAVDCCRLHLSGHPCPGRPARRSWPGPAVISRRIHEFASHGPRSARGQQGAGVVSSAVPGRARPAGGKGDRGGGSVRTGPQSGSHPIPAAGWAWPNVPGSPGTANGLSSSICGP